MEVLTIAAGIVLAQIIIWIASAFTKTFILPFAAWWKERGESTKPVR